MKKSVAQLPIKVQKHSVAPSLEEAPTREPLEVAGLFAGIGGLELGLARHHHETTLLCEIDAAANAVLDMRFEGVPRANDVKRVKKLKAGTSLLTAGFPCQDLSQAGKTAGIAGEKSGLVTEVFRILDVNDVEWVLLENVSFMLQLGGGRALDVVLTGLEERGYKWAYRVVNSRAFGVPQRRERVYFLASRSIDPRDILFVDNSNEPVDARSFRDVACGFYWTEGLRGLGWAIDAVPTLKGGSTIGIPSPPAIILPSGRIVKPDLRDAERMQGFDADWTEPAERVAKRGVRWKLVGNAVTVNAADWLGARLRKPGSYDPAGDIALQSGRRWPTAAYNVGRGRFVADISTWPRQLPTESLTKFLRYPVTDLSEKATAGFYSRAQKANLRFPPGFLDAVHAHLCRMRGESLRAII